MKIESEPLLDFCDVYLKPSVVSNIRSREEIDTSVLIGNRQLKFPLIGSPMKDVCDGDFGSKLIDLGCFGIIHRFSEVEKQLIEFEKNKQLAVAIGINGDYLEIYKKFILQGCNLFCIDVANGANIVVKETIERCLQLGESQFIVGNVASAETFKWVSTLPNVIAVRVGIAGGNACTTKNATGIYCPMASLILECKEVKDSCNIHAKIIADGGIKEPSDFCKAIALGADCVMMGSILAAATDSPAELIKRDGKFYKIYHGSASFEIQKTYKEKPKYIEGRTALLDFNNETIEQIVGKFIDGLKSSMSYFDSKNIENFHKKANWCHI